MQEGAFLKQKRRVLLASVPRSSIKYMSETYCWTHELNREDYGVYQTWVLLDVVKESTRFVRYEMSELRLRFLG